MGNRHPEDSSPDVWAEVRRACLGFETRTTQYALILIQLHTYSVPHDHHDYQAPIVTPPPFSHPCRSLFWGLPPQNSNACAQRSIHDESEYPEAHPCRWSTLAAGHNISAVLVQRRMASLLSEEQASWQVTSAMKGK